MHEFHADLSQLNVSLRSMHTDSLYSTNWSKVAQLEGILCED